MGRSLIDQSANFQYGDIVPEVAELKHHDLQTRLHLNPQRDAGRLRVGASLVEFTKLTTPTAGDELLTKYAIDGFGGSGRARLTYRWSDN